MTNPLLEEVYRAREKLWQRAGGTMRGLGEYLMEYRRRADARGVKWIESEEELEAIGAEVRARLAAEEKAMCVGEAAGKYVAKEAGREAHTEAQRDGGTEGGGEAQKGRKGKKGSGGREQGSGRKTTKLPNHQTAQLPGISAAKGAKDFKGGMDGAREERDG